MIRKERNVLRRKNQEPSEKRKYTKQDNQQYKWAMHILIDVVMPIAQTEQLSITVRQLVPQGFANTSSRDVRMVETEGTWTRSDKTPIPRPRTDSVLLSHHADATMWENCIRGAAGVDSREMCCLSGRWNGEDGVNFAWKRRGAVEVGCLVVVNSWLLRRYEEPSMEKMKRVVRKAMEPLGDA